MTLSRRQLLASVFAAPVVGVAGSHYTIPVPEHGPKTVQALALSHGFEMLKVWNLPPEKQLGFMLFPIQTRDGKTYHSCRPDPDHWFETEEDVLFWLIFRHKEVAP